MIYATILTAEYVDERETFDVDIRYNTELPVQGSDLHRVGYSLVVGKLANGLQEGHQSTAFTVYSRDSYPDFDEFFKEYFDTEGEEGEIYWLTWLEDNGYDEFVQVLSNTAEDNETYLLASRDPLPEYILRDEARTHLHDLKQQRERRWAQWGRRGL